LNLVNDESLVMRDPRSAYMLGLIQFQTNTFDLSLFDQAVESNIYDVYAHFYRWLVVYITSPNKANVNDIPQGIIRNNKFIHLLIEFVKIMSNTYEKSDSKLNWETSDSLSSSTASIEDTVDESNNSYKSQDYDSLYNSDSNQRYIERNEHIERNGVIYDYHAFFQAVADDTHAPSHMYIGLLEYTNKNMENSMRSFDKCISIDIYYAFCYYYRGLVKTKLGHSDPFDDFVMAFKLSELTSNMILILFSQDKLTTMY
jgi:hypothetical protein